MFHLNRKAVGIQIQVYRASRPLLFVANHTVVRRSEIVDGRHRDADAISRRDVLSLALNGALQA